jgi:SagB-type dehydrogenase family enzyme
MDEFGKRFIAGTSLPLAGQSAQTRGEPQPPLFREPETHLSEVSLPDPAGLRMAPVDLRWLIGERHTVRRYADRPISLEVLSFMLWATQGVKQITERPVTLRTVPSAGARHPFETLLMINRVGGVQPGLYYYHPLDHALWALRHGPALADELAYVCLQQAHIPASAVTFIWALVPERTLWRYSERSYRYMFMDAGHVCQNLYLAATALGCGVCAVGAFRDADLNAWLGLDGETQLAAYVATVGLVG